MSSTSHRNSGGNYEQEQNYFLKRKEYVHYPGRTVNTLTCLPGDGLLGVKYHSSILSKNAIDIESQLFGIGSTNLVEKKKIVLPQLKHLKSLAITQKQKIHLPESFQLLPNQRPFNV